MSYKKSAVVLIVKDEVDDILTWLAWHHKLCFSACIVFDDYSKDGTWEALKVASEFQDIRLQRSIGDDSLRYQERQRLSYLYAIDQYKDEFEWMAFFDADEFLSLRKDNSIDEFLSRFEQADAVAINWCCYGSSNHVLKPPARCLRAFTNHGSPERPINRHVKSIVRPRMVGPEWVNVHFFDIPPDRYVLADGQKAQWSSIRGISGTEADWEVAKIMHFQCRSMEQFVQRIVKRKDIKATVELWNQSDQNEFADVLPESLLTEVEGQISVLKGEQQHLGEMWIADIGMSEGNDTAFYLKKGFKVVGVEADEEISRELRKRFCAEIESKHLVLYNNAAGEFDGDVVQFFHHNKHQGISGLSRQRQEFEIGSYVNYQVSTISWQTLARRHGIPYYMKIDIEGAEASFLRSMSGHDPLPEYISVECHTIEPVTQLFNLGYRLFKLVDQNPVGGFRLPEQQMEGHCLGSIDWAHTSGPFGRELPKGDWMEFEEFVVAWRASKMEYHRTWFDCHAWMPEVQAKD